MSLAVLFPGQGSQFLGMADTWISHPAGRAVLDQTAESIGRDVVAGCRDERLLSTTEFVQPALLACDVAAFRILEDEGVEVAGAAGHSLGEFAALVAAGVLDLSSALSAVVARGRAMQVASREREGAMTALVGVGSDDAAEICAGAGDGDVLAVANENAPDQVVLSGAAPAIERAEAIARARGARAIRLDVAGAFHSPLMEPAVEPIRAALAALELHPPRLTFVANVTGTAVDDPAAIRELLARHVVSPVRWDASMRTFARLGFDAYVEAGPGRVLSRLLRRGTPGTRAVAVASADDAARFARSLREAR